MEFNLAEKLAIVKAIDKVILADQEVARGEMKYLGQLMKILDFDSEFVEEARKFHIKQANAILEGLSEPKKHSLGIMLHEMAYADGYLGKEEVKVLFSMFETAGIKIEEPGNHLSVFDISDVYFKSSRHIQRRKEKKLSEEIREKRAIKIEPHIEGKQGFTITTFRLDGILPFWGNKVELAPKHMDIFELNNGKSILKGSVEHTTDFSDPADAQSKYSLSIYHPNNEIEKIVLHNHEEHIDIEYLK